MYIRGNDIRLCSKYVMESSFFEKSQRKSHYNDCFVGAFSDDSTTLMHAEISNVISICLMSM